MKCRWFFSHSNPGADSEMCLSFNDFKWIDANEFSVGVRRGLQKSQ
jgi:hypothetical protein